ncbi:hypothetical protein SDJN03_19994, partial [Cucurbita argyrosperma subsp. sororia]
MVSSGFNQNLMFQTAVLGGGVRGKRYGMIQGSGEIAVGESVLSASTLNWIPIRTTTGSPEGFGKIWIHLPFCVLDASHHPLPAPTWLLNL